MVPDILFDDIDTHPTFEGEPLDLDEEWAQHMSICNGCLERFLPTITDAVFCNDCVRKRYGGRKPAQRASSKWRR